MKKFLSLFLAMMMVLSICSCEKESDVKDDSKENVSSVADGGCAHDYEQEVIVPQCTVDGYTKHTCELCDNEYISDIVYASGHSFSEWKTETVATCKNVGEMARKCSNCGFEEKEEIPFSSHKFSKIGENNGITTYQCEVCERSIEKETDSEFDADSEKTLFNCDVNYTVKIQYSGNSENLKNMLEIIPYMLEGTEKELSGAGLLELSVSSNGNNIYSVKPKNGFEKGEGYVVKLKSKDVSFSEYPQCERLIIRVKADEKFELKVNEDIKFIKALNDKNPGYYPYSVTVSPQSGEKYASIMKVDNLKVGDIVCLGEYSNMEEVLQSETIETDYCFGKISKIYPSEVGYVLVLGKTGAGDIYTEADISYTTGIVLEEESLTEEEKKNIQNSALSSVLKNEDFVTYLAATESAATEYLLSRGLEPSYETLGTWGPKNFGGFEFKVDYSFDNTHVSEDGWENTPSLFDKEYIFKKYSRGSLIKITLNVSRKYTAKTQSGIDAGSLDVGVMLEFVCEPTVNLEYKTENDIGVDDIDTFSVELVSKNSFTLDFKVHAGISYSLENTPYVCNENTGTYHCTYCRIYEMNENKSQFRKMTLETFASETKDIDKGSKIFCGVCKPQTDLKNDNLLLNTNTGMVHIHGCSQAPSHCVTVQGLASKYKQNGYKLCKDCEPEKQQSESFKDIVDNKIKSGGFEKEVAKLKEVLQKNGAVETGTAGEGKSLIRKEIPVGGVFKLMVQLDLVLNFDLNATMQYKYTTENTITARVDYLIGEGIKCSKGESDKKTTQTVDFSGTSRAELGINFSLGVAVIAEDIVSAKVTASVGVYARLNGMFHCDIQNMTWYGGAYFEAGTYFGVGATVEILWNEFPIPVVEKFDVPFFKLGYDEIWLEFITTPTTAEMQGNVLNMNANEFLKVKTYDLTEMKTGEKTLSFNGDSYYKVNVTFENGTKYLTGENGLYKVSDGVTDKFIENVTISVEGTSSWKTYKDGQAVSFLEPYTFTVEYDNDYLLESSEDSSENKDNSSGDADNSAESGNPSDDDSPDFGDLGINYTLGALKANLTDGVLTIWGKGAMPDYSNGRYVPWHNERGKITKVIIKNGVTSIGACSFIECLFLENTSISSSVTSIGEWAFSFCRNLKSAEISNGVKSIGNYAFYSCDSLSHISIGCSVTSIGDYAFCNCYSLVNVTIHDSVTSIGDWAFRSCTSLASVTIGDGVKSIGDDAFAECTSLVRITIPDSVASIGDFAFSYCLSLVSITIPESVTSIGVYAFSPCRSITSVTFENPDGWYVTKTKGASSGTDVDIVDKSTTAEYLTDTYCNYYWYRK